MNDDQPFSLETAWAHLADLIAMVITLFGAPAAIAARLILTRRARQDLLGWLAPLEALARRLLTLEAARRAPLNDPPRFVAQGRLTSALRDKPRAALPEDASQWRVRFVVCGGVARKGAGEPVPQHAKEITCTAWPLARRLEALRRLIADPADAIRRIARRLAANRPAVRKRLAPYRHAGPVRAALAAAQAELDLALADTS